MKKISQALIVSVGVAAVLTSCTTTKSSETTTTTTTTTDATGTTTVTSTSTDGTLPPGATATDATSGTGTATDSTSTTATATDSAATAVPGTTTDATTGVAGAPPDVQTNTLPNGQKQVSINMNDLPSDTVICTVGGVPLKVGTYKSMLMLQQVQMTAGIGQDPKTRARLLAEAKKNNITLTADEKQRLVKTAKDSQYKDDAAFQKFLKEKHLTAAQYENEIYSIGLAYKVSSMMLQQGLLPELVNREILVSAAKADGLEKGAIEKYNAMKNSQAFPAMEKQSGLAGEALKEEIIKSELAKLQMLKLAGKTPVTDADLKKVYDQNKTQLRHDERIKLASILVLAPTVDIPPTITSIKSEVRKAEPKLTEAELDAKTAMVDKQLEQRALVILGKAEAAKNTAEFAKLANENTDDLQAKANKTGGELGWVDKASLTPAVAAQVWTLKPNTVLPRLIKTEIGYQIIRVNGHEKSGFLSFNEVKPLLAAQVQQAKATQTINKWLMDKHKTMKIEYSPKFVAIASGGAPKAK